MKPLIANLTTSNLTMIALTLAIVVFLIFRIGRRELTWRQVGPGLYKLPKILAIVGAANCIPGASGLGQLSTTAWLMILLELATAAGAGVISGMVSRIRTSADGPQVRGGWLAVAVWGALIVTRIAEQLLITHLVGDALVGLPGLMLIMIAVNRFVAASVISNRVAQQHPLTQKYASAR